MKIKKEYKTTHIAQLPGDLRVLVAVELVKAKLSDEDRERAMDGRVCDLEDTIKIVYQ